MGIDVPDLSIVFMGTPDFALPSLEALYQSRHQIVGIVTAPDKPRGRGQRKSHLPVKSFAQNHSVPLLQPDLLKDSQFIQSLQQFKADLFVVVAFRILPAVVFEIPPQGSVNLHASLLPKYRGAAPINWALMNGEKQTGVTTFFIRQQVDTGSLILQKPIDIAPEDDTGSLHDKLASLGAGVLLETVESIAQDNVETRLQDESQVSAAPKIHRHMCAIDWRRPAVEIQDFIRGLSPYPAAFSHLDNKTYKILKAHLGSPSKSSQHPGTVLTASGDIIEVQCGDGSLLVQELQPPSRKHMSSGDFLRGHALEPGDQFT